MKIKQVEELVGITSKNIRFYEDQGLLSPKRTENGYRDYGMEEVKILKRIKLFRKLGVSVEEIHKVFNGIISVSDCLERQELNLKKEQENILKMCELTRQMQLNPLPIDELDSDYWLDEVEKMEKEGINFVNLSKIDIHMKKKIGAAIGAVVMILIMMFVIVTCIIGYFQDPQFPIWALLIILGICGATVVGAVVAMVSRMKEIDKGEEDEAAKY